MAVTEPRDPLAIRCGECERARSPKRSDDCVKGALQAAIDVKGVVRGASTPGLGGARRPGGFLSN